ncbi:MAG: hypothetical protein ACKKMP_03595 [Candidatus Nealsonbacteria bacterium]
MTTNKEKTPFKEGTKIYKTFIVLSDLKWHCSKHELAGTQPAKAIQIIRQNGFKVVNKTSYCKSCQEKTVHRMLISLDTKDARIFTRSKLPAKLKKRIKEYYKHVEAITLRSDFTPSMLEVDHKFPQVRWGKKEPENPSDMDNKEIRRRFMLLTRANNLWKSRYCERCYKTGIRGIFPGINFFYKGNRKWDKKIDPHSPEGCEGCFWYDPFKWREALNLVIKKYE